MECEWRTSTWGDEISLEYGKSLRGYQDAAGKFRVFGSNGPIGWTDRKLASGPGVILGRKGAYRGVEFSKDPFFVIDTAYYVVPKTDLDMRWLYYAIKHYKLGEIDDGSPIPSTARAAVYARELEVPPLAEQALIATALSVLDDRIDNLRATNTTLEAIAQALFKSWFVDFDPVHAKAEGRDPEAMDAATAALFPSEFEESELGLIPKGWRVGCIGDLLTLQRGFDLPASQRIDGEFPILAASGPSGHHQEAKVTGPGVTTGRSGVLGRVFYVTEDFWPLNTSLWIKDFKIATAAYAYQFLKIMDLAHLNAGSAVPTLNRNHVHGVPCVVPDVSTVEAYTSIAAPLLKRVHLAERHALRLSELRDTLLPRLISGKLRLPEATEAAEMDVA